MPRTARITYPQGFYHIYNRGINKDLIFREHSDYIRLLGKLADLLLQGDWTIYAYCLMPNHYHLIVEEKKLPIAKLINRLFTGYSQFYNHKYGRVGPVFQDRFKSKLVQKDNYFLEVSRYIHCNPVKAGLVKIPEKYLYSSMGEYMGVRHCNISIINPEKVTKLVDDSAKGIENYHKFVNAGVDLDLEEFNPFLSKKDILGSSSFITHRKIRLKRLL